MTDDTLMQAAADVARLAGDVARSYYRQGVEIGIKEDGSPVTAADRAAERIAREWIEARFPDDGILGEEYGEVRAGAPRRWVLDPIDGTRTFVRGVPLWGSLVAIHEGDTVLAGAAYFPVVDEIVVAAPGQGCWWNGTRCRVSDIADISAATLLTTDDRFPNLTPRREAFATLAVRAGVSRTWGDCYGYLLVATGRAEIMVDNIVSPWDAAAFLPIIQEAGGVCTDWQGNPTPFGGDLIATNEALARETRDVLGGL